jgi:hypothetical protein
MPKLIGLSLSNCVKDIVLGRVNLCDVEKIISRTAIHNKKQLEFVLIQYADGPAWAGIEFLWESGRAIKSASILLFKKRLERAKRIARELYAQGRIEQPRITQRQIPDVRFEGWWINAGMPIGWIDDPEPLPDEFNEWYEYETLETIKGLTWKEIEKHWQAWHAKK